MTNYLNDSFEFFQHDRQDKIQNMPSPHHHSYHELYYLVRGQATYFVGNSIYLLKAGDFCFIPKGEFHQTNYDESSSMERLLFVFDDDFLGRDYKQYIDDLREHKQVQLEEAALAPLQSLFIRIEEECTRRESGYREMNKLYLRELLLLLHRHRRKNDEEQLQGTHKIVQSAVLYIERNYAQNLSVASLAAMYSLSVGYFSKQFKQITGIVPSEYLTMTRITAAKEKLAGKKMRITDVALECGFSDSNYFALVFKKTVGVTPKKYASGCVI